MIRSHVQELRIHLIWFSFASTIYSAKLNCHANGNRRQHLFIKKRFIDWLENQHNEIWLQIPNPIWMQNVCDVRSNIQTSHTIAFQISGHNAALSIWSAIVHLPCEIDEQIGQMDNERNIIHLTNGVARTHVDHFDVHRFHSDQLNPNQNWYGIDRGIYGNNRQSTHWTLICFCFERKYATCIWTTAANEWNTVWIWHRHRAHCSTIRYYEQVLERY